MGDGVTRVQHVKRFEICRTAIHDDDGTGGVHTSRTILNEVHVEELVVKKMTNQNLVSAASEGSILTKKKKKKYS